MISKRAFISAAHDNYARLAAYIAEAGPAGEKCLMHWCSGMLGGDEYQEGIAEAMDVQRLNTRAAAKTYHLVISFRPEDEAKLTPETFKVIEERFAAALGYTDHQRHCGVHKNTANLHMHVAYNMIHPEKLTCHKEFRDFWVRDRVCRNIEHEFGLTVDNGIMLNSSDQTLTRPRSNEKAQLVEAHTGQQSFDSYAKTYHESIMQSLESAASWQDVHKTLAAYGMEIKPHGNGLVIKDRHGKHAMKASALDRSLSQKKLEARFGPYVSPGNLAHVTEHSRYQAEPLHRSPERGELFTKYRMGIEERKTTLQQVKEGEDATLAAIRERWTAKRKEIERMSIAKRNRRNLLQLAKKHEAEALARARIPFQEQRTELRKDVPFTSWNSFLRHESEQGNDVALAILRSRQDVAEVEAPAPSFARSSFQTVDAVFHTAKERELLERTDISGKGKKSLLAVLRMDKIIQSASSPTTQSYTWKVDNKGIVAFMLPGGGVVRDTGKDILFSANSEPARQTALLYARKKWRQRITLEENKIVRQEAPERAQGMER